MNYPIFIPMKGESTRFKNKNCVLLPILTKVFNTYYNKDILNKCIIITESRELIALANGLGYKNIYQENKGENKSEFHAIMKCIDDYNDKKITFETEFDMTYFFLAPVTQPLKSESFYSFIKGMFLRDELDDRMKHLSFITTVTLQPDRSIFEYNMKTHKFEKESKCRKGEMCENKFYIDGCWYFIKTENISNMIWSQNNIETCKDTDINEMFWSSKFEVERNDDNMFCDIDTYNEYSKLFNTSTLINKIYKINLYKIIK